MIKAASLLHHVREFEQAEVQGQLGIIEKPTFELQLKRIKEVNVEGRIFHPVHTERASLHPEKYCKGKP